MEKVEEPKNEALAHQFRYGQFDIVVAEFETTSGCLFGANTLTIQYQTGSITHD